MALPYSTWGDFLLPDHHALRPEAKNIDGNKLLKLVPHGVAEGAFRKKADKIQGIETKDPSEIIR